MDRKRKKLSPAEPTPNNIEAPVAGPSNQPAPIFKLNTDCCDHIFDYFHPYELHTVAKTSKAMQQVAGEYFKRNYNAKPEGSSIPAFHRFIRRIKMSEIQKSGIPINQYKSLTHLTLRLNEVSKFHGNHHNHQQLSKIRTLEIQNARIDHSIFYERILKYFKKLENLIILSSKGISSPVWLLHTYPTLKYFRMDKYSTCDENMVGKFLERNSSIQTVSTIIENVTAYLDAKASVDTLDICVFGEIIREWKSGCDTIDQLYEQGFYKRLHLTIHGIHQALIDRIAKLKGLERFFIYDLTSKLDWTSLGSVRELGIIRPTFGNNNEVEALVKAFENIEFLHVMNASVDDVMPFIFRSQKLKKIKMSRGKPSETVINLQRCNKKRANLGAATKVMVYVEDIVFVPTKWKTANGDIDLEFIEMRRYDSDEWKPLNLNIF